MKVFSVTMNDEVRRVAELLCNCAKSRGRHSLYCPSPTALPKLALALQSHRARMLNRDSDPFPDEPTK